jgi:ankyrin repeat protein
LLPGASRTGSSRYSDDGSLLPCPPPSAREQISDALYVACRNGHLDVVRFLLAQQPDLSFRAYMGGTPLHWAHFGGSREVIVLLEQAGADRAARDNVLHCTPRAFGICVPANWGFAFLVRKRLQSDPSLAQVHDGSTTPLHEAANSGNPEVVQMLLVAGANPAAVNDAGQTPLDVALARGQAEAAALLRGA